MIKLIRDNVQGVATETLTGKKFSTVVLDSIISTATQIKERTEADDIIIDVADILELLNVFLISENIKAQDTFTKAEQLRNELGSYSKKLIIKE